MSRLKLFVGNLPSETAEQDLRALFASFGEVREVHIMSSARSRLGYACAFVVFGADAKVDDAIAMLHGKHRFAPDGEALTVSYARAEEPKKARQQHGSADQDWQNDPATQMWYQQQYAMQLAMMQAYGMYAQAGQGAGATNPYAMSNPYAMLGADALTGASPYGMFGADALTGAYPGAFEAPQVPGGKGGGQKESDDAKLFLGGLPNGVTEAEIRTVFSQVGTVKEVHIMHGKSQSGQACAFVVYPDLYSAQLAIRTLNKTPWHSAPDQPPIIVRAADKVLKKKGGAKEASAAMINE